MKDHVKILLVGDDSVGKSSLLSAYMSKHFPAEVPPLVVDSTIPADKTANGVSVTIMDSSSRPGDREALRRRVAEADVVVALYDVTRPETLESLEQYWLPLLQHLFAASPSHSGKQASLLLSPRSSSSTHTHTARKSVIVVGTKTDLLEDEEDVLVEAEEGGAHAVERLSSLLKAFPAVLLCLQCSAKRLEDVESVFYYAELVVSFPVHPLFDVASHEFTPRCRAAMLRVFRVFDADGDSLLCDSELAHFQWTCFSLSMSAEEIRQIKRNLSLDVLGGVVRDGITFEGFLGLLAMGIEKHQLQIPWTILRRFNYDNDLQLQIPAEILTPPALRDDQMTELSASARSFLLSLSRIAYNENTRPVRPDSDTCSEIDECLTSEAVKSIFSVLPLDVLTQHPWTSPPTFQTPWSSLTSAARQKKGETAEEERTIEQTVLLSDMPYSTANVFFDRWLQHWNQLAVCDPVLVQKLLFQLGYAEREDLGIAISSSTIARLQALLHEQRASSSSSSALPRFLRWSAADEGESLLRQRPRSTLRIAIFGDNRVGKSSFVWTVSELRAPGWDVEDVEVLAGYEKPLEHIVVGGCVQSKMVVSNKQKSERTEREKEKTTAARNWQTEKNSSTSLSLMNSLSSLLSGRSPSLPFSSSSAGKNVVAMDPVPFLASHYELSFAAVPLEHVDRWCAESISRCDMAMIMFQCGDLASLEKAFQLERRLPLSLPRFFVATKADLFLNNRNSNFGGDRIAAGPLSSSQQELRELQQSHELVLQSISLHTKEQELPPVVLCSTKDNAGIDETLQMVRAIAHNPLKGIPAAGRKTKTNKLRNVLIVTSVVCAASLSFLAVKYNKEIRAALDEIVDSMRRGSQAFFPQLTSNSN